MPLLPITALYGALLGFLLLHLAYLVVMTRQKYKSALGHKNDDILIAARNHANAAEYIPIMLILLALAELNGAANGILHIIGALFVAARYIYAWGFRASEEKTHPGRYWGIVITFFCIATLGLLNLYLCWPYLL
ncbi:MAG: putative membrane protein YecN with MAPEG domain [Oceanicoccus sp.]|jgi:uncharacterized membrane protein YecN with MAPEG domain